jgi:hypothetical protein
MTPPARWSVCSSCRIGRSAGVSALGAPVSRPASVAFHPIARWNRKGRKGHRTRSSPRPSHERAIAPPPARFSLLVSRRLRLERRSPDRRRWRFIPSQGGIGRLPNACHPERASPRASRRIPRVCERGRRHEALPIRWGPFGSGLRPSLGVTWTAQIPADDMQSSSVAIVLRL